MSAKAVVKHFIRENLPLAGGKLADDVSLLGRGILDSVGILELVAAIEDAFHIQVADAEVRPDNFDTLDAIESFVARKLARGAA
jgi:acyl carrier protein